MARDVFISYRHEDQAMADRVRAALEERKVSCWIASRDIGPGQEWASAIVEGIQRCHTFVLILSSNSRNTRQIGRELELADNGNLRMVAFRIEDVQPPPGLLFFLGNVQSVDAFDGQFQQALARLTDAITNTDQYPAPSTKFHHSKPMPAPVPPVKRNLLFLKMAAVALLAAGAGAGTYLKVQQVEANRDFEKGEMAYRSGDWDRAIQNYSAAIQTDGKFFRAYCKRARVYLLEGDIAKADADVRHVLRLDRKNDWAKNLRTELDDKSAKDRKDKNRGKKLSEVAERQTIPASN
jgi:tetratricopeptide (TPR) repeat protein